MSLILDALNRSREDSSAVPGLATRHEYVDQKADRRILTLGTVLVFALVAIAWLLWDKREQVLDTVGVIQQETAVDAAALQPAAAPETAATVVPPTDRTQPQSGEDEQAAEAPKQAPQAPATANVVKPVVTPTPAQKPTATDVAALYQPAGKVSPQAEAATAAAPVATAPAAREERDMDIGQLVTQAESELKDARLSEHPASFINDLSQQTKDGIPTVYYQRHEYSGRPAESRVVLNGKKLKKGDSPVAGVRVEEILPDSVVLSHDGTQFRLRALNSWVNL